MEIPGKGLFQKIFGSREKSIVGKPIEEGNPLTLDGVEHGVPPLVKPNVPEMPKQVPDISGTESREKEAIAQEGAFNSAVAGKSVATEIFGKDIQAAGGTPLVDYQAVAKNQQDMQAKVQSPNSANKKTA